MKKPYLKFVIGKESALGIPLFGGLLTFIGAIILYEGVFWGIFLIITGLAIVLAHSGVLLDMESRRVKVYTWVLFFKIGTWEPLSDYPDVLALRRKRSYGYSLRGIGPYQMGSEVTYEVLLGNHNHMDNLLVSRKDTEAEAYALARELAATTGSEFVQFNPGRQRKRKLL